MVFDYLKWNYEADDDEADTVEYPLGYFFSGDSDDEKYILTIPRDQMDRQILAQYPSEDVMERSAVMQYFDNDKNAKVTKKNTSTKVTSAVKRDIILSTELAEGMTIKAQSAKIENKEKVEEIDK